MRVAIRRSAAIVPREYFEGGPGVLRRLAAVGFFALAMGAATLCLWSLAVDLELAQRVPFAGVWGRWQVWFGVVALSIVCVRLASRGDRRK